MTTRLAALILVVAIGAAGCGSTDGQAAPPSAPAAGPTEAVAGGEITGPLGLALQPGSSAVVEGYTDAGEDGPRVPMEVAYESMECVISLPEADVDEFNKPVDMTAADGEQLCLVQLSVTNVGEQAGWFAADLDAVMEAGDGQTYDPSPAGYDPALMAEQKDLAYAASAQGMAPGETAHDFVVYPIPLDVEPVALVFGARG
jgi:hypothetical protein